MTPDTVAAAAAAVFGTFMLSLYLLRFVPSGQHTNFAVGASILTGLVWLVAYLGTLAATALLRL